MESENNLFQIDEDLRIPLWDIIRYHVYIKYYYPENDCKKLALAPKHSILEHINLIKLVFISVFRISLSNSKNIFFTASRNIDKNGFYFDKSSLPIIDMLGKDYLVIEPILERKVAYNFIYDFNCLFRKIYKSKKVPISYYNKIDKVIVNNLGENRVSYKEINEIFHNFRSDFCYYKFIFKLKKTKNIFISTGNPKALLLAARKLGIKTFLLQHAGIEFDEIDYSYPSEITKESNILFANYVLTLGDYWCKNINIPTNKIISIGNDFFFYKPTGIVENSILIISTIIHGGELRLLTKELANFYPNLMFVYKLHPNEFHLLHEYINFFNQNTNVTVITNQTETNILISRSQLVILIVSAVLYEALNQNKKVAIYKKINFERQLPLAKLPNVYLFDYATEIFSILSKVTTQSIVNFYKPTDLSLIIPLLNK